MAANRIIVGSYVFEDDNIITGNCYIETDLTSSSLSINTFDAEVRCADPALSRTVKNELLIYFHGGAQIGIFFVQSVKRVGPDRYQISAVSAMGLLDQRRHYGGIYTGQAAKDVIADICGPVPVYVKTIIADKPVYGWLPIGTARENLSQVVFALGAAVKTDLDGVIRVEGLWDGLTAEIGMDQMSLGSTVEYTSPVTSVVVTEHQYTKGGEETTLFEGTTLDGDMITFNEPMYDLNPTGFFVRESGANYAIVTAGSGVLKGKRYIHNTRQVSRPVSSAQEDNVITVEQATLVSLVNSVAVADRLARFYACRESIQGDVAWRWERPGDVAAQYHPFDKTTVISCLQSVDINLSGRLKGAETSVVGFLPQQFEDSQLLEYRVVLTGSGEWVPPDGVTSVRRVLIGAGTGGQAGFNGEKAEGNQLSVTTHEQNAGGTWSVGETQGGDGGDGGAGASGGKIYQDTVDVTPGVPIHYQCGTPGRGGSENGALGTAGGDTVFGDASSAQGAASDIGFTDPVTGQTYAKPGKSGAAGVAGGKGGNAGASGADYGENGKDFPPNVGGAGRIGYSYDGGGERNSKLRRGGNGGGGAAKGADGGTSDKTYEIGAPGASAVSPDVPDKIGSGGNGGNGGGGGGGAGAKYYSCDPYIAGAGIIMHTSGGVGGNGSPGSHGGEGGIILYFSIPKIVASGQFVDRNNLMLLDRLGRRFVV